MTQNIITADEIREGDRIKVTVKNGDRTNTYEGVANHFESHEGGIRWRTVMDYPLWTDVEHAVIELLDRPGTVLPTLPNAVVKYTGLNGHGDVLNRTAVRDNGGLWKVYDDGGHKMDTFYTDEQFAHWVGHKDSLKVVFGGVAK